jgi:aminopeptidase N
MKTQTIIITILLATLLTGCGIKKEDHQRVLAELEETKQALEQSQSDVSRLKAELTSASSRLKDLAQEVEKLKNSDRTAFANASSESDRERRKAALLQFIESFPLSDLASNARKIIDGIDEEVQREMQHLQAEEERQRRIAYEAEQRKRQELAELQRRIASGNLTFQEWSKFLVGQSSTDVIALIGRPTRNNEMSIRSQVWRYSGMAVDSVTGARKTLRLQIDDNVVTNVNAE